MNAKSRFLPGLVLLVLIASGSGLFGQSIPKGQRIPTGRQVPPLPRAWDQGLGSWASVGLGPSGFVAAFSRELERTVVTFHPGLSLWDEAFSGVDLAATIGLPLSRGRVFASVGGGLGCMIGKITGGVDQELKIQLLPCLAADLQLSLRLTSRLGLGFYVPFSVSTQHAVLGLYVCLQFGTWQL